MANKKKESVEVLDISKLTEAEKKQLAKEAAEKAAAQTIEERAAEYFEGNEVDSILMTSDKAVFLNTIGGKNAAENHSKTLDVKDVYELHRPASEIETAE
jgi:hypothetical protein